MSTTESQTKSLIGQSLSNVGLGGNLNKMRDASYLLPPPGGEVARELIVEIVRLREALTDVAESKPLTATPPQMVRALQSIAREALTHNV